MTFSAKRAKRQIERAEGRRKDALAELVRADGKPLYSKVEEGRRRDEIEAEYRRELRAVKESIDAETELIRSEEARLENRDPMDQLNSVQRSKANELGDWIKEDITMLEEPVLIRRIQDAIESEDKARLALILRYASLRKDPGIELRSAFRAAEPVVFSGNETSRLQERRREVLSIASHLAAKETLSQYRPPATRNPFA